MDHVAGLVADQERRLSAQEIEAAGQVTFDFGAALDVQLPEAVSRNIMSAPAEVFAQEAKNVGSDCDPIAGGDDTVADEAADGPVRQPFGEWLLTQKDRKGWIGDLAKAATADRGFPKRGDADDVRKRLKGLGADGDSFEAVDDAELDWLTL